MEFCLRYNVSIPQQQIFKSVCKALLLKSKSLVEKVEDGDWVHISVVSNSHSGIKVYYDGMFDPVILKAEDFITPGDLLYSRSEFEIKGYVSLDTSVDIT